MSKNALKPTKDVFNNDHCNVTMTYFTRKINTYLVRINMYATTLCFEFFYFGPSEAKIWQNMLFGCQYVPLPFVQKRVTVSEA